MIEIDPVVPEKKSKIEKRDGQTNTQPNTQRKRQRGGTVSHWYTPVSHHGHVLPNLNQSIHYLISVNHVL